MSGYLTPRRTVMELRALLGELRVLAWRGDRSRYLGDSHYRWVIHRLWIAVGNEVNYLGEELRDTEPWRSTRLLRNQLAHIRLPEIDDEWVWSVTTRRPADLLDAL